MANDVTTVQGALLMIVTMFGGGILMMPCAFRAIGWLPATAFFIIIDIITGITMYFLTKCASESNNQEDLTYYSVCQDAHPSLGTFADLLTAFLSVASPLAYLGLITTSFSSLFHIQEYRIVVLLAFSTLALFLAAKKDLSSLRHASYLSVTSVICLSFFVMYIFSINHKNTTTKVYDTDFSTALGQILFAVGCQQNMISVYSQLKDKRQKSVIKMILLTCLIGPLLYCTVGFFGYAGIGEAANVDLLKILTDPDSSIQKLLFEKGTFVKLLVYTVVIAFDVTLLCSVAFQINPGKTAFANLFRNYLNVKRETTDSTKYHYSMAFMVILISFIANALKFDYGLVVNIVGSVACNGICYILPSVTFFLTMKKSFMRLISAFIAMIGIISLFYATGDIIYQRLKPQT